MSSDSQAENRPNRRPAKLDHLVINALLDIDMAQTTFAALGFTITPRGYHSLGSMNHLMVAGDSYLELVGVPRQGLQRQDVLESPIGLSGLVFQSADADATHARLVAHGLPALDPLQFFRPIDLDGVEKKVGFRIVRLDRDRFPAGRIYFCQHLTPDLVWRPQWLHHDNGFQAIASVTVESGDAAADADLYATLADTTAEAQGDGYRLPLDCGHIQVTAGAGPGLRTASLIFENLERLEQLALKLDTVQWLRHDAESATLRFPALQLTMTCLSPSAGSIR